MKETFTQIQKFVIRSIRDNGKPLLIWAGKKSTSMRETADGRKCLLLSWTVIGALKYRGIIGVQRKPDGFHLELTEKGKQAAAKLR